MKMKLILLEGYHHLQVLKEVDLDTSEEENSEEEEEEDQEILEGFILINNFFFSGLFQTNFSSLQTAHIDSDSYESFASILMICRNFLGHWFYLTTLLIHFKSLRHLHFKTTIRLFQK